MRFRNESEIGSRYRTAFGPIGFAACGIYTISVPTNPGPFAPGASVTGTSALRYYGLDVGILGAEVTIDRSLSIGANTMFGAFNGSWGLQNKAGPGGASRGQWSVVRDVRSV